MKEMYEEIERICMPLDGWTTFDRLKQMADLIGNRDPKIVVELGVFGGRSFLAQAIALKHYKCNGQIYGVDPWRKAAAIEGENSANAGWWGTIDIEAIHRATMKAMWDAGLEPWATVIRSESQNCHPLFNFIDILNIDANHSEIASCRDVANYLPRVRKDGFIWFDDADWSTTHKAQQIVEQQCDIIMDNGHWKLYRKK